MSLSQVPLTIIVAATAKNGIGKNGGLPWPMLKKDMAYFARVTKRVPLPTNTGSVQSDALKARILEGTQRNAVIMGRKTWDSIPVQFRPLRDRTNLVISSRPRSDLRSIPDDVVVAADIPSGLRLLEESVGQGKTPPVGRVFVMGGASIYQAALELPQTSRILLTRISKPYDCDVFFPAALPDADGDAPPSTWMRKSNAALRDFVNEDVPDGPTMQMDGDEDLLLQFQLFERI